MTTPLLPFGRRAPDGSRYVDALLAALDGRGWRSARSLAADLGTDDRTIRAAAAACLRFKRIA